ncbi:MAG: PAS domain S-box protein [Acidobacteriota bacterium]
MSTPLRVLLVKDRTEEPEPIQQELEKAGFQPDIQQVEIEPDYFKQLDAGPDIVVADFELLQFDALRALELLQEKELKIPFLVVSEEVGSERAVECIRRGAADFLLKDHLSRLGQVVKRSLQESKLQREKEHAEANLQEGIERFRQLIELSPIGIALVSQGALTFVNRAGAKLLGAASPKQLTEKPFSQFIHPDSQQEIGKRLEATQTGEQGEMVKLEAEFVRLDGEGVDLALTAVPFQQEGEASTLVVFSDISERKQAQESLAFGARLFSNLSDAIVAVDNDRRITYWNKTAERMYGVPADEALGTQLDEVYQERSGDDEQAAVRKALEESGSWQGISTHVKKGGEEAFVASSVTLLKKDGGQPDGFLYVLRDVTRSRQTEDLLQQEHKLTEDQLEKERNLYSSVVDNAAAPLLVVNAEGQVILFNQACEKLSGYRADEVKNTPLWELPFSQDQSESMRKWFEGLKVDQFPEQHQNHWVTKEGNRRLISWASSVSTDEEGSIRFVISAGLDITEFEATLKVTSGGLKLSLQSPFQLDF